MSRRSVVLKKPSLKALTADEIAKLERLIATRQITRMPVHALKPNPRNAKRHPQYQIDLLAENIRKFGQTVPLLVDEDSIILAGHGRLEAMKRLGMSSVAVIMLENLSPEEKKVLTLADNKLPELGSWDDQMLKAELSELSALDLDIDYDPLLLTGFDTPDIDRILLGETPEPDADDDLPPLDGDGVATCRTGDILQCGQHKLICGDARDASTYNTLLEGDKVHLVFTDPPYNVPIVGNVTKRSNVREFAMGSGEMAPPEFTDFLRVVAEAIAKTLAAGAVSYICMDWRHYPQLVLAVTPALGDPKNCIAWVKTNAGQGSFYRSQHEFIAVFVAKGAAPTNNFKLGERGRLRSNVWRYPGVNYCSDRHPLLALHPTVKPTALVSDALRDCSRRGDIVLDAFGGSGTTLIAAHRTGRVARLIEIDPLYCDLIARRWQAVTGEPAIFVESGKRFDEIVNERDQATDGQST